MENCDPGPYEVMTSGKREEGYIASNSNQWADAGEWLAPQGPPFEWPVGARIRRRKNEYEHVSE
jgi:hypothetical protein